MPLTWSTRWKFIGVFLPLLTFSMICLAETVSFRLWARGELELSRLGPVLLLPVFLLVVIFIGNEIRLRSSQRSKKLLNVLENGISLRASGRPAIRWSKIVAFWFEDIPDEIQFSKLTMEYFGDRKTKIPRRSSLVLEKRTQCQELISELKLLQQKNNLNFRIELNNPLPPRKQPRNLMLGMSLYLAGMLFLLHGMPMLLVPLTHHTGESNHSDSSDRWSPKQQEKFDRFLAAHFSTKAELKKIMIESGGILSTIGIALMVCGTVIQRQKSSESLPASQSR